jgi:hypothetical protein
MPVPRLTTCLFILLASAAISTNSFGNEGGAKIQRQQNIELSIHKNPNCGCCGAWVEHTQQQGFTTTVHNHDNLNAFKAEHGIPANLQACHTSVSSEGFVFEGHIPARYITQFLTEKPKGARGLIVANMPMGSPGMDMGPGFQAYDVLLLLDDGSTEVYATIKSKSQQ